MNTNSRRQSGATLAFVATGIVIVILIAVAFYFITQLLGGGRELQHATDSGSLNVAKQATISPMVSVATTDPDINVVLEGALPAGTQVNLLNYNRMVGEAMLIAMNAEADGGPTSASAAQRFIDSLQGSGNSVGASLKAALSNYNTATSSTDSSPWAQTAFNTTGLGNSLRMLGTSSNVTYNSADFRAVYWGQNANDPNLTNISFQNFLAQGPNQTTALPFANIGSLYPSFDPAALKASQMSLPSAATTTINNTTVLKGYSPINFPRVSRNLYAVPLDTAPHLVSLSQVPSESAQPGASDPLNASGTALPPNAFINGATGRDQKASNKDVHMLAAAMAGTNQAPFTAQIRYGYIAIDNSGVNAPQTPSPNPNVNNVFANELSTGIDVDPSSGYFSDWADPNANGKTQVQQWETTPRTPDAQGNPFNPESSSNPGYDHMFDQNGDPVSSKTQAANNIPYSGSSPNAVTCNDTNSDPGGSGTIPTCAQHVTPPNGPGSDPFDRAYYPNGTSGSGAGSTPSDQGLLTAAEQSCSKVINLWDEVTNGQLSTSSAPWAVDMSTPANTFTGLRLYPTGHNPIQGDEANWAPPGGGFNTAGQNSYSDPSTPCKVTSDGTIAQLIDQTIGMTPDSASNAQSNQAQAAVSMIIQRMAEICGDINLATSEYNRIVKATPIPLGTVMYISLDPTQGFNKFIMNATKPFSGSGNGIHYQNVAAHVTNPDGQKVTVAMANYGITQTLADPHNQWGIHDHPMLTVYDNNGDPVNQTGSSSVDPSANMTAMANDTVNIYANSGAYGNLLNIQFLEKTTNNANGNQPPRLQDRD